MLYSFVILLTSQVVHAACLAKTFDYVIIGGGPAGLVVANRLSANPNTTVAVIEAGDSAFSNPNVTLLPRSLTEYGRGLGTTVDWNYTSAPQKYTSNRTLTYYAGKALGGTTTINGMTYLRAERSQIDAWEALGNGGWNWNSMYEQYVAQEGFQAPTQEQQDNGAIYDGSVHRVEGELGVGFNPYLVGQGYFDVLKETSEALGYPSNRDANSGYMRGTSTWPMMIDIARSIREDAARAFYYPVAEKRPNLHVFLNTTATRIIWNEDVPPSGGVTASGVEVVTATGETEAAHAIREVIVSAGSIKSPSLLEHSGIGNPAILESLGVKTVVAHPTVGSNLQDQPNVGIIYTSSTNWTGYPTFVSYLTAADLFGKDLAAVTEEVRANLTSYAAAIIADYAPGTMTVEVQTRLLEQQLNLVFAPDSTVPLAELLWAPTENAIIAPFWSLLPFARGSVHIASTDPLRPPSINPHFFQLPIDSYIQAAAAVCVREFFSTAPFSDHIVTEVAPSFDVVPQNATWRDPAWDTWIKQTYGSNSHPVSTCAMMSRELGGVVDGDGKVYGTANVRVVDASIFPTQISGHLSASVYAIAGRIASKILEKS